MSKKDKPPLAVKEDDAAGTWHVLVRWPGGRKDRVEGFDGREDAEAWISLEASDRLAIQIGDG